MKRLKQVAAVLALVFSPICILLVYPNPLFAHEMTYGQYEVRSDRLIDPAITQVLDDVTARLRQSDLYSPQSKFRIYICNEAWRLWFYSRNAAVGGVADTAVTRNIYIREANIALNTVISPTGGALADADIRTLSYFVAHEAAHIMQSRAYGRALDLRYPSWLVEGHADLIAKAGAFDLEENRRQLRSDDYLLTVESGLYRRYHLMVASLMSEHGRTMNDLFADPPSEEEALRSALNRDSG